MSSSYEFVQFPKQNKEMSDGHQVNILTKTLK